MEQDWGYNEGYKFLYCPWETIKYARYAFISLNPGTPPDGAELRTISDERGNSYVIEQAYTRSPITKQFLLLCGLIGIAPEHMLTGVAAPFRTPKWLNKRDKKMIPIGIEFWSEVFECQSLEVVFCLGRDAENVIVTARNATLEHEISSGWGAYKIRRYVDSKGCVIIGLLHLSTFKMLSRDQCVKQIQYLLS